ncbi:hypothetical protein [Streptomyces sp. SS07]|uniref:hypothetical protein n=1 Tax=Streptomyces sp. SS07 TaxID=2015315 RepID=UPI000B5C50BC|nr:hypothetical protein [Streptomyces sp. SS07]
MYFPPHTEHDDVIKAALRVIQATHYYREDDPNAGAEQEYAAEQLALTARALVQAVDSKPEDEQPIGWRGTKDSGPDTKFCVLCLSGEHQRVDNAPTTEVKR